MKEFSIIAVIVINILIAVRYCWLTYKQRIKPSLAMWMFFTIAVIISLSTYLSSGNFSLLDNVLNSADLLLVISVTVAIFLFGDKSTRFKRFDIGCLVAVTLVIAFWAVSKNYYVTHLSVQLILVIAYFPVVKRLWNAKKNTESFLPWMGMFLAAAFSLISSKGSLATIYAIRAMTCVALLILLMVRVEIRGRRLSGCE